MGVMFGRARRQGRRLGDRVIDERRVAPVSKAGASCVPFVLTITQLGKGRSGDVRATAQTQSGRHLGEAFARWNPSARSLDVFHASVPEPGCGVGTRLYEALAGEACTRMSRLRSDTDLSPYSKGFWKKQERRGRARWDSKVSRFVLDECVRSLEGRPPASLAASGRRR